MSEPRNAAVDGYKLVAACGVVAIHLAPSTPAAASFTRAFDVSAVPFFFLISLYFFIRKFATDRPPGVSALHLDRILVPYASWTVLYTAMQLVKAQLAGEPFSIDAVGFVCFGGAAVHLYFLPLLLLGQAQFLAITLLGRAGRGRLFGFGLAVAVVLFGAVGSAGGHLGFDGALERCLAYVAMAYGLVRLEATTAGRRFNAVAGWATVVAVVATAFVEIPFGALGLAQGPVVGYGVAAFALHRRFAPSHPALRHRLTCSYGIYLAHFGVLEAIELAAGRLGFPLAPYSLAEKLSVTAAVCLGCVLLIAGARAHGLSAYLFLGEKRRRVPVPPASAAPLSSEAMPAR